MTEMSANEALENAILWSVTEMIEEIKRNNRGNENMIMRDIKSLHGNMTKGDLPDNLKKALTNASRGSMGYLNKNGYKVVQNER